MSKLNVIALMGGMGAGKDTAGQMLLNMGNGVAFAFADKLKSIIMEMFQLDRDSLYDEAGKEALLKQFPMLMCPECHCMQVEVFQQDRRDMAQCKLCRVVGDRAVFASFWTGRKIAQFVGTECFRTVWAPVWTDYALRQAAQRLGESVKRRSVDEVERPAIDFVVITDCRFPNEAEAVLAAGGEVWRLKRPNKKEATGLKNHASETAGDAFPDSSCSAIVMNDGTLDDLRGRLAAQFQRFRGSRA